MAADATTQFAKAQSSKEEDNLSRPPNINLPKGGGAIRGIGEKFSVNPVTGTGSLTVPIFTSPGRSDFFPKLSLSYNSGAGNGPFALGWHLSIPSITRKTDKGLPLYNDARESDVFILSDAEDLVPVLGQQNNRWEPVPIPDATLNAQTYAIKRYRPRIEGLFARIERWRRKTDGDIHWRATTKDNVTSVYGQDPNCRIADPQDATQVFRWLLEATYDEKGNVIFYEYKPEDTTGVNLSAANERNRQNGNAPFINRYIKHIHYGSRTPYVREEDLSKRSDWLFEIVFDYGEHNLANPTPGEDPAQKWITRADPFSNFRSTFDIRTYRLCQRVLMFHHFPQGQNGETGYDGMIRATDFIYDQQNGESQLLGNPIATKLLSITQTGYALDSTGKAYLTKSFPPLDFTYSEAEIDSTVLTVEQDSLENLPEGLDGSNYQWLDLDGEGLSGILTQQAGALHYKRNLSPLSTITENGDQHTSARFGLAELLATQPGYSLMGGRPRFMDLASEGHQNMVSLENPVRGYYERGDAVDGSNFWNCFHPFRRFPNLDTSDPNLKFVDIDGDGLTDMLVSEDDVFAWYRSCGQEGFDIRRYSRKPFDEERGAALVFADPTQSIFLADMVGDGLTDIVRIRNGEVCYWPNLGYGRFGAKVTMDGAPSYDTPDVFDPRRIRLADIDGCGTTDILYLGARGVAIYHNQSGNSWSGETTLPDFPALNDTSVVNVVDLLGNGTACLVWSSPLLSDAGRQMRYINLMGSQKPHLLIGVSNNLGAGTRIRYASSAKFYVEDREAGTPWVTKLAFPVHVAERVEVFDYIGRTRLVTTYRYRHGYFDGVEREFRGFGYMEQTDAESFGDTASLFTEDTDTEADALHVPPVVTKTWFHTGAWPDEKTIAHHMARDYFGAPSETDPQFEQKWTTFLGGLLPDTVLPPDILQIDGSRVVYALSGEEQREAIRALKGSILRQEIYADDSTAKASIPYSVSERNYTIETFQPQGANRFGVFFTHARETIDYHHERNPADPRILHSAVLSADPFGNVLTSVNAAYGRNPIAPGVQSVPVSNPGSPPALTVDPSAFAQAEQFTALLTLSENTFTNPIDEADAYRTPSPAETRNYELTCPTRPDDSVVYSFQELQSLVQAAVAISYEIKPDPTKTQKRLLEDVRALYLKDDLSGPAAPGQMESLGLGFESYKLALPAGLAQQVFITGNSNPNKPADLAALNAILTGEGGYVNSQGDGDWWMPSGQTIYSPVPSNPANPFVQDPIFAAANFYLPQAHRDPVGQYTRLGYDSYNLLLAHSQDALGNTVVAQSDYRVLQPTEIIDPNGNHVGAAFDVLGMVVGTAIKGKVSAAGNSESGDSFTTFTADLAQSDIDSFFNNTDPLTLASGLLSTATTRFIYDLERFSGTQAANPTDPTKWEPVFAATLSRETHVNDALPTGQSLKIQVSFSYSDGLGREIQKKIQAEPGPVASGGPDINPRWVGSGWTILNNKGKPVRQYEPFFSATHDFEFANKAGVTPTLFYDPLERVIATLYPNHTWEKVVFDAWMQKTWDVNDTVQFDPKTDSGAGYLFGLVPDSDYLPTWYQLRIDPAQSVAAFPDPDARSAEQDAAIKAAAHNDTPTGTLFDVLGRPLLSVADNRFQENGVTTDEFYTTRTEFDIENNQLSVTDPLGRELVTYDYDMTRNRIHQASMEAGERWMLKNIMGKPIRGWDGRGFMRAISYDELQRSTSLTVTGNGLNNILAEKTVYGDSKVGGPLNPEQTNHRGRIYQAYDAAGVVTSLGVNPSTNQNEGYDFKGNPLRKSRQLLGGDSYKTTVDWNQNQVLDEIFASSTRYDALNRPSSIVGPDQSETRRIFNESNLLEKVDVRLRGANDWTPVVTNIDYNTKGQRELIEYGNGASTTYDHDPETFRLTRLRTTRLQGLNGLASTLFQDASVVQDLNYAYDPLGNITRIRNDALPILHYNNEQIGPASDYTYDAIYRLLAGSGREHIGQTAFSPAPQIGNLRDYPFMGLMANPNDLQAMRNCTEQYGYDAVGNFEAVIHVAQNGNWTRNYNYNEASLLEPGKVNNRLSSTQVGNSGALPYAYDIHGNMVTMPHLPIMEWDFKDQLHASQQQVINNGGGEKTYYLYDASGQRSGKITQTANGTKKNECIYLDGFEVYREYDTNGAVSLARETLHVLDDKQRVALVETKTQDASSSITSNNSLMRYQFGNHLGSASLELDEAGQVISYEEYFPFGSTSYQSVRSQTETTKNYRYTAKERDEENGFYYHGARYYAPWLGRWTSIDPSGLSDGVNPCSYVRNNPIRLIDPNGRFGEDPDVIDFILDNPAVVAAAAPAAAAAVVETAPIWVPAAVAVGVTAATVYGASILGDWLDGHPVGARPLRTDLPIGEGRGSYDTEPLPEPEAAQRPTPAPAPTPTSKRKPDPRPEPKPTPDLTPKPDDDDRRRKRGQIHHIASHENWISPKFEKIFADAALPGEKSIGLDDPVNLVRVPGHKGPHGNKYSNIVLNRLTKAVKNLRPHTAEYKAALYEELGRLRLDVNDPKSPLFSLVRSSTFGQGDETNRMSPKKEREQLESIGNPNQWGSQINITRLIPD
jgi:RHS repeat-associated protein